jgi:hypothetical protein
VATAIQMRTVTVLWNNTPYSVKVSECVCVSVRERAAAGFAVGFPVLPEGGADGAYEVSRLWSVVSWSESLRTA